MRRDLARLQSETHDVVVVGGGIHGAWLAMRAAAAGLRIALIERDDFGAATSANSLKILHGGLRYLQHLDLGRMRDSIRARREFLRWLPNATQPLSCLMPLQATGVRSPWFLWPALLINDLVSADRNRGVPPPNHLPRGRLVGRRECAEHIGRLASPPLVAGARWWDGVALDVTRLVLEPLLQAAARGAVICNRVEALDLLRRDTRVCGVIARDRIGGGEMEIRGRVVVDAAGPWAGQWARGPRAPCLPRAWLGAMNLVLNRYGISEAMALSSTASAGDRSAVLGRARRELFFVPWCGRTLIGTHYARVAADGSQGPPEEAVNAFIDDVNRAAPGARLQRADIARVHWGLLPADSADSLLPSKAPVLATGHQETGFDGLVLMIGEKLTSAPVLSEKALACVRRELAHDGTGVERSPDAAFDPAPAPTGELATGLSDARVRHAVRAEMALSLEDILHRRLGLADHGPLDPDWVQHCARIAAPELGWNPVQSTAAADEFLAAQAASGSR